MLSFSLNGWNVLGSQRIDLGPYVNTSALCVHTTFSVLRTYILFRTLGLRHLVVVDDLNRVVGMVTRKDLLGQWLKQKLNSSTDLGDIGPK
eukprot:817707-Prorocentrum_minimum.AAC.4